MTKPAVVEVFDSHEPWKQAAREPSVAYEQFLVYLELGKGRRTQVEVAKRFGVTQPSIASKCSRWHWVTRARSWDASKLQEQLAEIDEEYQRSRLDRMAMGRRMQGVAGGELEKLEVECSGSVERLPVKDIRMLAKSGAEHVAGAAERSVGGGEMSEATAPYGVEGVVIGYRELMVSFGPALLERQRAAPNRGWGEATDVAVDALRGLTSGAGPGEGEGTGSVDPE